MSLRVVLAFLPLFIISAKGQFNKNVPLYCTPTGQGVCNLGFEVPSYVTNNGYAAWAYDNYCREIGNNTNITTENMAIPVPSLPDVLSIDVGREEDNTGLQIDGFYYAGKFHDFNTCWEYNARDEGYVQVYQCAFDC